MRKFMLIVLPLVLALVSLNIVCADDGLYVIQTIRGNYAPVPKTGKTVTTAPGDDGALQKGVASPTPRFIDNGNGTITDKLTGLIWTKNANAFGIVDWPQALSEANDLKDGIAGLTDGSKAGDWRLPNVRELQSLIDYGRQDPALPLGHPFTDLPTTYPTDHFGGYWSSTTLAGAPYVNNAAWAVSVPAGYVSPTLKGFGEYVWCVRGGP